MGNRTNKPMMKSTTDYKEAPKHESHLYQCQSMSEQQQEILTNVWKVFVVIVTCGAVVTAARSRRFQHLGHAQEPVTYAKDHSK